VNRTDIIQHLIDNYALTSYLEIGVFKGVNFENIKCDLKHSVDPHYPATYQMTSNKFFRERVDNDYDIVFIDGMHTFNQTYADINNAWYLTNSNFIVVHDCNPATQWHTRPFKEYTQGEEWNGTTYLGYLKWVWDHDWMFYATVNVDYGCGVICAQNQPKRVRRHHFDMLPTWAKFDSDRDQYLNLIDEEEFLKMFS
jgi:hypothetical protein